MSGIVNVLMGGQNRREMKKLLRLVKKHMKLSATHTSAKPKKRMLSDLFSAALQISRKCGR
jgi:hypothetical protein